MPLLKYTRLLDISHLLSNQSEDCLYLNIYMPKPGNSNSIFFSFLLGVRFSKVRVLTVGHEPLVGKLVSIFN